MLYTILELESTGIGSSDSLVEVALLQMDERGRQIRRYESLVNPEKPITNSAYHGISSSMVQSAPSFREIYPVLRDLLTNTDLLLSFNLVFQWRLLAQEILRLGQPIPETEGQCLLRLLRDFEPESPRKLKDICSHLGVSLAHPHWAGSKVSALHTLLLRHLHSLPGAEEEGQLARELTGLEEAPRLSREDAREERLAKAPILERLTSRLDPHSSHSAFDAYFELLDTVFADSVLEPREELALFQRASELGMNKEDVAEAHQSYVQGLLQVAYQDGYYTEMEAEHLESVARALKVDEVVRDPETKPLALYPKDLRGKSFLLVGQPRGQLDGRPVGLRRLAELAQEAGLELGSKLGSDIDFVVNCGLASEAELKGIEGSRTPLVSEQVFWNWLGVQVK